VSNDPRFINLLLVNLDHDRLTHIDDEAVISLGDLELARTRRVLRLTIVETTFTIFSDSFGSGPGTTVASEQWQTCCGGPSTPNTQAESHPSR
jgi:hypothetical protein